jgi:dihydroorotate dehydrogenase
VQLYTALVYRGPGLVRAIKQDLAARLRADGFGTLAEAVGSAHR